MKAYEIVKYIMPIFLMNGRYEREQLLLRNSYERE